MATLSKSPWAILAITSLAVFAVMLDVLVLFVAFPAIERSFSGVSGSQLSWILNAYTIVYGALLVPAGRFADRFGRKRSFLLGAGLFAAASALCGIAGAPSWMIVARVLQAVGGAMLTPSSLAVTLAAFSREQRSVAVALWGAVGALAVVAGPPLGSLIVESIGWPGIFFLNLPIGLAAVIIGSLIIPESRDELNTSLPDWLGVVLLIVGTALLALGIVQSEQWGWNSAWTWAALLFGFVLLVAFVRRSSRVAAPVLDLTLFHDQTFLVANIALFLFNIGFTAMFLNSIFFLTRMWGFSITQTGLAQIPGPLLVVLLSPIAGRLVNTRSHRTLLVPGGLIYATGALLPLFTATATPHYLSVWLPMSICTGIGVALIIPVLNSAAVQQLPAEKLAVGSAVSQATRQFGSVLGVSLTFAILGNTPSSMTQFQPMFGLMVASGLSVCLLSLGMSTSRTAQHSPRELVQTGISLE